jgi:hypothetical protein
MDIEVFERLGGFDAEVAGVARMGRDQLDLWLEVGPDRGGQQDGLCFDWTMLADEGNAHGSVLDQRFGGGATAR